MTRRSLLCSTAFAALLGLGLTPGQGRATIIFTQESVQTSINIGHFDEVAANSAIGRELGNGPELLQVTTDTDLVVQGEGQAFLITADPAEPFTEATIVPVGVAGFTIIEFNPMFGNDEGQGGGSGGTFTLTALDQNDVSFTSEPFDLTNGENRVAAVALDGQFIKQLTFQTADGGAAGTLRQFRVELAPDNVIPEPATLSMAFIGICGIGGLSWIRRRRDVRAVA